MCHAKMIQSGSLERIEHFSFDGKSQTIEKQVSEWAITHPACHGAHSTLTYRGRLVHLEIEYPTSSLKNEG